MSESLDSDEIQQLHTAIRLSQTTISVSHKDLSYPYPLYPFKYTHIYHVERQRSYFEEVTSGRFLLAGQSTYETVDPIITSQK